MRSVLLSCIFLGAYLRIRPTSAGPAIVGVGPVVKLNYGAFQGSTTGSAVEFLGMPFAAPPLGHLRFSPPSPPIPFSGVQQATSYGAACFQQSLDSPPKLPFSLANNPISQDLSHGQLIDKCNRSIYQCYRPFLYASQQKTTGHNGGFEVGDTSANPGNSVVARSISLGQPVIYVSANYRLNAFGFLGGKEVKAAGLGNIGLRDQRFAMEWIQKYISAFGGDPKKVTIWGESAGAWSVGMHHIINNGVQGSLFRGAIMESGSPSHLRSITKSQPLFDQIASDTGCKSASNVISCLRDVPFGNLTTAINRTPNLFGFNSLQIAWQPTVDGVLIKQDPLVSIQKGLFSKVPIITGDCDDEGTLFSFANQNITTDAEFLEYMQTNYDIPRSQLSAVAQAYPADRAHGSPYGTGTANALTPQYKRLASIQGDLIFQAPRRFFLQAMARTQKTYAFLYKRGKTTPFLGSLHSLDLAEFYGVGNSTNFVGVDALINFVNNLDPNTPADASKRKKAAPSALKWNLWGSSTSRPPMLTFIDPAPNVTITFDIYRRDAMKLLTDIMLGLAFSDNNSL